MITISKCVIYKGSVWTGTNKYYFHTDKNTFKGRCNGHTCSSRSKSRKKNTQLSKYVLEVKKKDIDYAISWDIPRRHGCISDASLKCLTQCLGDI